MIYGFVPKIAPNWSHKLFVGINPPLSYFGLRKGFNKIQAQLGLHLKFDGSRLYKNQNNERECLLPQELLGWNRSCNNGYGHFRVLPNQLHLANDIPLQNKWLPTPKGAPTLEKVDSLNPV